MGWHWVSRGLQVAKALLVTGRSDAPGRTPETKTAHAVGSLVHMHGDKLYCSLPQVPWPGQFPVSPLPNPWVELVGLLGRGLGKGRDSLSSEQPPTRSGMFPVPQEGETGQAGWHLLH